MDLIESDPTNSMVTQPSDRGIGEPEAKQATIQKEKQVIANNYYISDKERAENR